jgi:RNA 2',3'-cyclic 3'-phosphodiesterase
VCKAAGTLRLFFALQPEPWQKTALAELAAPLAAQLEAPVVPAENIHATLCFIGAVAPEHLEKLKCVAAAQHARGLSLRFDTFEYWEKPRVLCATGGGSAIPAAVLEFVDALGRSAQAAGFQPDIKPFRPHLTLARKITPARAARCEWPQSLVPPLLLHCDRFVLMESRRGESASTYSVVDSWPLYADDTDSSSANIQ